MYHEFDCSCHNKSNFTKISHSESEKLKKNMGREWHPLVGMGIPSPHLTPLTSRSGRLQRVSTLNLLHQEFLTTPLPTTVPPVLGDTVITRTRVLFLLFYTLTYCDLL